MSVCINTYEDEDGLTIEIIGDKGHRFGFRVGEKKEDCGWHYVSKTATASGEMTPGLLAELKKALDKVEL